MSRHLSILEEAISDVGYWRWWVEAMPRAFQVEFGGVQLHFPPSPPDKPPNSVTALRFDAPTLVAFLTANTASIDPGWRMALHRDECDAFTVNHELFTLTSDETLAAVARDCSVEFLVGSDLAATDTTTGVMLAFRAQEVGLIVRAREMTVVTVAGELSPEQVERAAGDWWEYWREYWRRRETEVPMPKDYACEVTLPLK